MISASPDASIRVKTIFIHEDSLIPKKLTNDRPINSNVADMTIGCPKNTAR